MIDRRYYVGGKFIIFIIKSNYGWCQILFETKNTLIHYKKVYFIGVILNYYKIHFIDKFFEYKNKWHWRKCDVR